MVKVHEVLAERQSFSFELWPPRSEKQEAALARVLDDLQPLHPTFVSITYGAGGSTRDRTHDLVVDLLGTRGMLAVAHLTTAAHTRAELVDVLARYRDEGVENVLALRGDPPLDAANPLPEGELHNAVELVDLARSVGDFSVGVAVHPEGHPDCGGDLDLDRRHTAEKMAAADYGISQFFFRAEDYLRLVDELAAAGIDKPVLPGIMPVDRIGQVTKMAQMAGTQFPPDLAERLHAAADKEEVRRIGVEVATDLCLKLLAEDVPGLHFYTMNRSASTLEVYRNLGLAPA
jgi:methylenetetrahydrofolate reductase (NADPH)